MFVVNLLEKFHIIYGNADKLIAFIDEKITAFITMKPNIHQITEDLS